MEPKAVQPAVTAAEMRALEAQAVAAGATWRGLMERAGQGVTAVALHMLRGTKVPVVVLVGPGNNGGDGLVVADELAATGLPVTVYLWHRVPQDNDWPWQAVVEHALPAYDAAEDQGYAQLKQLLHGAGLVVDGLLGSGVNRPLPADLQMLIMLINNTRACPLLAIDLPTGINADTGAAEGAALQADVTAATGRLKWGHLRGTGQQAAGRVEIVPIGIDEPKGVDHE